MQRDHLPDELVDWFPDELVQRILDYLSPENLLSTSLVRKKWYGFSEQQFQTHYERLCGKDKGYKVVIPEEWQDYSWKSRFGLLLRETSTKACSVINVMKNFNFPREVLSELNDTLEDSNWEDYFTSVFEQISTSDELTKKEADEDAKKVLPFETINTLTENELEKLADEVWRDGMEGCLFKAIFESVTYLLKTSISKYALLQCLIHSCNVIDTEQFYAGSKAEILEFDIPFLHLLTGCADIEVLRMALEAIPSDKHIALLNNEFTGHGNTLFFCISRACKNKRELATLLIRHGVNLNQTCSIKDATGHEDWQENDYNAFEFAVNNSEFILYETLYISGQQYAADLFQTELEIYYDMLIEERDVKPEEEDNWDVLITNLLQTSVEDLSQCRADLKRSIEFFAAKNLLGQYQGVAQAALKATHNPRAKSLTPALASKILLDTTGEKIVITGAASLGSHSVENMQLALETAVARHPVSELHLSKIDLITATLWGSILQKPACTSRFQILVLEEVDEVAIQEIQRGFQNKKEGLKLFETLHLVNMDAKTIQYLHSILTDPDLEYLKILCLEKMNNKSVDLVLFILQHEQCKIDALHVKNMEITGVERIANYLKTDICKVKSLYMDQLSINATKCLLNVLEDPACMVKKFSFSSADESVLEMIFASIQAARMQVDIVGCVDVPINWREKFEKLINDTNYTYKSACVDCAWSIVQNKKQRTEENNISVSVLPLASHHYSELVEQDAKETAATGNAWQLLQWLSPSISDKEEKPSLKRPRAP